MAPPAKLPLGSRIKRIYNLWKRDSTVWNCQSFAVVLGKGESEQSYRRSVCLYMFLFGVELPNSVLLFTPDKVLVVGARKQVNYVKEHSITSGCPVPIEFVEKSVGDLDGTVQQMVAHVPSSTKQFGWLTREKHDGDLVSKFKAAVEQQSYELVNIQTALSHVFGTKDESELENVKIAAQLSAKVLKPHALRYIEKEYAHEEGGKGQVTHEKMSTFLGDNVIGEAKYMRLSSAEVDPDLVEACYPPIIQSGGDYQLKPNAVSSKKRLSFDTIVVSLGCMYKFYCSNVARTILINAKPEQEQNWNFLCKVFEAAQNSLKVGARVGDAYKAARALVESERPELKGSFVANCGFGIGLEFRDSTLLIKEDNDRVVEKGMCFNVAVGFQDLKVGDRTYALLLADTVIVEEDGSSRPSDLSMEFDDFSYTFDEEDEEQKRKEVQDLADVVRTRELRERGNRQEENESLKRKEEQDAIGQALHDKLKRNLSKMKKASSSKNGNERDIRSFRSVKDAQSSLTYIKRDEGLRSHQIYTHFDSQSVILPIRGGLVPFHVAVIKSINCTRDGQATTLRISFAPGREGIPYIREMLFRTFEHDRMETVTDRIKEMRRVYLQKENARKTATTVVKAQQQGSLVLNRSGRQVTLRDVYIRPSISRSKSAGFLEMHQNGFRFKTAKADTFDILFDNIAFSFFQSARRGELSIVLHFHLKNPVAVGKKTYKDVQFYAEIGESVHAISGRMARSYTEDEEMRIEQHEHEVRLQLNKRFKAFAKQAEDQSNQLIQFERPFNQGANDLSFDGSMSRGRVKFVPTVNCLVQLADPPFFVLDLKKVQIVHFERVHFNLREFDMVFVLQDEHMKPVDTIQIASVPTDRKEVIQDWLSTLDIKYYEGTANLNWKKILASVNEDLEGFIDEGGWDFLDIEKTDGEVGEEEEDDELEGDEEYESPVSSEEEDSEEYESDEGDEEDEEEDDYSDEEEMSDEEEEGKDWDELEMEALKDDRKRKFDDDQPVARHRVKR